MKLKNLLTPFIMAGLLGLSSTASAEFDFGSPFDWFDDDDDYYDSRYSGRRGDGRDRWRRYDEWEPNYWRYRFFDDDSDDYIFDDFDGGDFFDDGNFFGDGNGRGRFDFDMNMDSDFDGFFDGDYDDDYRYRGDRYGGRNDRRASDRRTSDRRASDRPSRRDEGYRSGSRYNDDRYDDDYWRNYSRQYSNGGRMSRTPEYEQRRTRRDERQPRECR